MSNNIQVTLLPHTPFLKKDGTLDLKKALDYSAKIAGECYEPLGWEKLKDEPFEKTEKRESMTLNNEHQTPYEHINIGFEIVNIPKIVAMILNNERQCSTSEKSSRYTPVDGAADPAITTEEENLYNKWMEIFKVKIKEKYGNIFDDKKITKLAQENSRYLVTVFMSTKMIHTLPLIQLNRICGFMRDLTNKADKNDFEKRLSPYLLEFIDCFEKLNCLDSRMQTNRKNRKLSLFSQYDVEDSFDYSYSANYKGSFAQLAQAHRHRTLEYSMRLLEETEFFVPPILEDDQILINEWINDMKSVAHIFPQGELISINESGTFDKFILKTKERLCSAAQLEICNQTKETLNKMIIAYKKSKHPLLQTALEHSKGARCTFSDFTCSNQCAFKEGINLKRKI